MISLRGLRKDFGSGPPAVDGIDLEVPAGSFLVLLGPSGCGKTTTLRMLAGLENPTGGEIRFGDRVVASATRSVPASERGAGMVFQSYALWPHMSVRQNVEWPLKIARKPGRSRRVADVLELLGIGNLADRYPGELSGGQQQRVAIARTIAPGPGVLLFDEPLSNLDAKLRTETRAELLRIHRETGATSVYVTHDQVEAMTMATHLALLNRGRVEQFGHPLDLLRDPASPFVATFLGTPPANVLDAVHRDGRLFFGDTELTHGTADAHVMYRAESITLGDSDGPVLRAEFAEAAPMAGRLVVTATVHGRRISAVVDELPGLRPGDPVLLRLPRTPDRVFASELVAS